MALSAIIAYERLRSLRDEVDSEHTDGTIQVSRIELRGILRELMERRLDGKSPNAAALNSTNTEEVKPTLEQRIFRLEERYLQLGKANAHITARFNLLLQNLVAADEDDTALDERQT
jgi:hypothetical protein